MNKTMTGVKLCYKLPDDRLHETEAYVVHYKKGDTIPFLPNPKEVQYTKISKWIDKKEQEYKYYHIYCGFDIETNERRFTTSCTKGRICCKIITERSKITSCIYPS